MENLKASALTFQRNVKALACTAAAAAAGQQQQQQQQQQRSSSSSMVQEGGKVVKKEGKEKKNRSCFVMCSLRSSSLTSEGTRLVYIQKLD
jgi:hypothetical protein